MKRLIPVIHIETKEQVFKNIETCLSEGVNNVFLINHIHVFNFAKVIYDQVRKEYKDLWIGANFLDLLPKTLFSLEINSNALWTDYTVEEKELENKFYKGEIFSGLNFKYQKQLSGQNLIDAINIIKKNNLIACTSGPGTNQPAHLDKIIELKNLLGDNRLALASGVSYLNIKDYLPYVDDFLVASSITNNKELIIKESLQKLIKIFKTYMRQCTYGYSFEWSEYKGYDKFEYDILLKDGTILLSCYPNGGTFNSIGNEDKSKNITVESKLVDKIRFTHKPVWDITKPIEPYPYKAED